MNINYQEREREREREREYYHALAICAKHTELLIVGYTRGICSSIKLPQGSNFVVLECWFGVQFYITNYRINNC
jgi:hypothetical protein